MKTISLTEFNRNPSRATRLADGGEVIVLRRGVAAYRLERVREQPGDPVEALIQAGLLAPARRTGGQRARQLPVARGAVDLGSALDADRSRLDA
ncbi:MAG: hypothetical protein LBI84_00710 [Propionibacteriaceae bacterium]|nr:hypothetical protein [Propionibacteriaceae bacterium]